jgi:hypothetical protein
MHEYRVTAHTIKEGDAIELAEPLDNLEENPWELVSTSVSGTTFYATWMRRHYTPGVG